MPQVVGGYFITVVEFNNVLSTTEALKGCGTIRINDVVITVDPSDTIAFVSVIVSTPFDLLPPELTIKTQL